MSVERVYEGTITIRPCGEDDDALWLDPSADEYEPLAGRIAEDIEEHGNTVTVSYWITDGPHHACRQRTADETKALAAPARADYDRAIATLRDVAQRTGSPAAQWAADYLAADPNRLAPTPTA